MIGSKTILTALTISFLLCTQLNAQQKEVQWISFEQLSDSLKTHPKKVFVDFYTSWCTYCRKMDKVVFTKPEVATLLNMEYYAVRMDAESVDTLSFDGQFFVNDQVGKTRSPVHQLAQILAMRKGRFTPPALIILDEEFNVKQRHFEYLDSRKLLKVLLDN